MSPMTVRARSLQTKLLWGTRAGHRLVMAAVIVVVEHRQRAGDHRRGAAPRRGARARPGRHLPGAPAPLQLHGARAERRPAGGRGRRSLRDRPRRRGPGGRPQRAAGARRTGAARRGWTAGPPPPPSRSSRRRVTETGEGIYDFAVPSWSGQPEVGHGARRRLASCAWSALIRRTRWELGGLTVGDAAARAAWRPRWWPGGSRGPSSSSPRARPRSRAASSICASSPPPTTRSGGWPSPSTTWPTQLRQQRGALEDANAELRQRLDELADLKSYTDNILASLTNGIVTVDLDGRVVTLNPAAELMTGFFAGEVTGRYCTEVFAAHARAGRDPHGDDRQPRGHRRPSRARLRRRNGRTLAGRDQRGAAQGRRGQGSRRDRRDPRSHRGARAGEPPAPLRPAGRAGQPRRRPRPRDQEPADLAADLQPPPARGASTTSSSAPSSSRSCRASWSASTASSSDCSSWPGRPA